uniref:Uncharacterized protein n=1 Tax=Ixodes scapularis TaxID=6945 RepID=A0A4D5RG64_IXOSC
MLRMMMVMMISVSVDSARRRRRWDNPGRSFAAKATAKHLLYIAGITWHIRPCHQRKKKQKTSETELGSLCLCVCVCVRSVAL